METLSVNTTMSSREVATLTGKRHGDVCRDIRAMLERLEINQRKFASVYFDAKGEQRTEYLLDRDTTDCLITGYEPKLRLAVIKRWRELEAPKTSLDLAQSILDNLREQERRQAELEAKHIEHGQRLEHIETQMDPSSSNAYFTVVAYANNKGVSLPLSKANAIGIWCANYCRQQGLDIGKVPDQRFGSVNSYPVQVLDLCPHW